MPALRLPSQLQNTATATAPWPVLISRPAKGKRLSWPEWLVTYPRTVTHLSTNRARRRATSLMRPTPLPLDQTANLREGHGVPNMLPGVYPVLNLCSLLHGQDTQELRFKA